MSYRPPYKWKPFGGEPEENSAQLNLKRSGREVEAMIPPKMPALSYGRNNECVLQGSCVCEDKVGANLQLVGRPSKGICSQKVILLMKMGMCQCRKFSLYKFLVTCFARNQSL